jgi:hypothetical protein
MPLDPAFEGPLQGCFHLGDLDAHPQSVIGIWSDSRIAYVNPAWAGFAMENQGNPAIGACWGLGSDYLASISLALRPFYERLLERAPRPERSLHPVVHEYECSSATTYRRFVMQVYALPVGVGFVIVNSLVVDEPHDPIARPPHAAIDAHYRNANGTIVQCAHCRRVRHVEALARWDWIPTWVKRSPAVTSHGLCPICSEYYYPNAP